MEDKRLVSSDLSSTSYVLRYKTHASGVQCRKQSSSDIPNTVTHGDKQNACFKYIAFHELRVLFKGTGVDVFSVNARV